MTLDQLRDSARDWVLSEQEKQDWLDWAEPAPLTVQSVINLFKAHAAPLILPQEAVIGKIKRDCNRRHRRL